MVFSLSSWEMAGVKAPARTEQKNRLGGFFYGLLPLLVGEGWGEGTSPH